MGKLLVFESGAVKLQMGDVLLDVAAGTPCQFRQDVAAVNVNHGQFVFLGDVAQRVVCSPNIDQLIRFVLCNHLTCWKNISECVPNHAEAVVSGSTHAAVSCNHPSIGSKQPLHCARAEVLFYILLLHECICLLHSVANFPFVIVTPLMSHVCVIQFQPVGSQLYSQILPEDFIGVSPPRRFNARF